MLRRICLLCLVVILFSCSQDPADRQPEVVGNQAVNCLHVDLGLEPQALMERVSARKEVPDLPLLKKVHLPENASDCQVQDFVDLILYLSDNQSGYYKKHPQVGMIRTAIKGRELNYVDVASNSHSPARYVLYALKDLMGEQHKDFVFSNFTESYWLIEVINEKGWASEVAPELVDFVAKRDGRVNYHYVRALVSLNDPSLHELMTKAFVNGSGNRHITYIALKKVEGFDTLTPMRAIWETDDISDLEADEFAYPLLLSGYDAPLDYLSRKLDDYSSNTVYRYNIDLMNALLGKNFTQEEMTSWLAENREKLIFDEDSKTYRVRRDG